jgi:hypothetical protein
MSGVTPKYTAEEAGRRGDEIYERLIRPGLEESQRGRVVAIDIETGEFSIADTVLAAAEQLRQRLPAAQIWLVRVGFPALHHFGMFRPDIDHGSKKNNSCCGSKNAA